MTTAIQQRVADVLYPQHRSVAQISLPGIGPEAAFVENFRIVEDPSVSQRFSDEINRILYRLFGDIHDFNEEPFDVLLSARDDINGGIFAAGKLGFARPTIYLTAGLLNAVDNEDQLAFVIAHELTHFGLIKDLGGGRNSVGEEFGSDWYSLVLAYNAGYNPLAGVEFAEKHLGKSNSSLAVLDVHGTGSDRRFSWKTALTALETKVHAQFPTPQIWQNKEEFLAPPHRSFFDKQIQSHGEFHSTDEALDFLEENILHLSNKAQVSDFLSLLSSLSIDPHDKDIVERLHILADRIGEAKTPFPLEASSNKLEQETLYGRVLSIINAKVSDTDEEFAYSVPIGWMRSVQGMIDTFSSSSSFQEAFTAAQELKRILESKIDPDHHQPCRMYLRSVIQRPFSSSLQIGQEVSWNRFIEWIEKDQSGDIARVLTQLGVEDFRLYKGLQVSEVKTLFEIQDNSGIFSSSTPYLVDKEKEKVTVYLPDDLGVLTPQIEFPYSSSKNTEVQTKQKVRMR
jgi:Peptidase family M48